MILLLFIASKFTKIFKNWFKKRKIAFRAADNDERIKRALKARITNSNNEEFHPDDRVYFKKDKQMEWSGPASVIGQQDLYNFY